MERSARTATATRLPGVARAVFKGEVVGLKAFAIDLDSFRKKGSARLLGIEAVGNHHVGRRFPHAQQGDAGVVLGHDHPLAIGTRRNLDIDTARFAVGTFAGERMVIHRHLNRGKLAGALDARLHIGRNTDVHILRVARRGKNQKRKGSNASAWKPSSSFGAKADR